MNDEILKQYEDVVRGRLRNLATIDVYVSHPRVMLREIGKTFDEITQSDVDNYQNLCKKNRKRNGNALRFYSIRKFFRWAGRKDIKVEQVTRKRDSGKAILDDTEIAKLITTIKELSPKHRAIFYLEFDAIRRPNEIRNLKLEDIYNGKIRYIGKTGQKTVTMTPRLEQAIQEYIKYQRPKGINEEEDKYLFICDYSYKKGCHYADKDFITRIIKEICMYAKVTIPPRETPSNYLIKRTTITYQLQNTTDPKLVQLQAGHEDISQTLQYDRIGQEHLKKHVDNIQHKTENLNTKPDSSRYKNILENLDSPRTNQPKLVVDATENDEDNSSYSFSFSFDNILFRGKRLISFACYKSFTSKLETNVKILFLGYPCVSFAHPLLWRRKLNGYPAKAGGI